MFSILICLIAAYLALAGHQASAEALAVHLPALAVVLAAMRLSPPMAAVWSFGIGLGLDALGRGPLGIHAASFVAIVWLIAPILREGDRRTAFRVFAAVVLAVLIDQLASALQHPWPGREQWPAFGLQLAATMFVTATIAGVMTFLGRQAFGAPCTIR